MSKVPDFPIGHNIETMLLWPAIFYDKLWLHDIRGTNNLLL
jgi:hypothetical protein